LIALIILEGLEKQETNSIDYFYFSKPSRMIKAINELKLNNKVKSFRFLDNSFNILEDENMRIHLIVEYKDAFGKIQDKTKFNDILNKLKFSYTYDAYVDIVKLGEFLDFLHNKQISYYSINNSIYTDVEDPKEMYSKLFNLNGQHVNGIGISKKDYLLTGFKETFGKKKKHYDPNNVLNRGKVL
jgi:hypothetical protein